MTESCRSTPRRVPVPPPSSYADLIAIGQTETKELTAQNEAMLGALEDQQGLITQLAESRAQMTDMYEAVKTALEHEEDKRLEAEQQLRLLEVSSGSLQEVLKEADAVKVALESELETARAQAQELRAELAQSQAVTAEKEAKLMEMEAQNAALKSELASCQSELKDAQRNVSELKEAQTGMLERLKASEGKATLLPDVWEARERLEKQNKHLEEELARARAEAAGHAQQMKAYVEKVQQLEAALKHAQEVAGSKDVDVNDLQWRCEAAEQAHATLQVQIKQRLEQAERVQRKSDARNTDLEQKCERLMRDLQQAQGMGAQQAQSNEGLLARLEKAEARMNEEALQRKKEAKRAKEAEARAKRLDAEVKALEGSLKTAQDGMGMMRTIAKIRNLDDETLPVGFDAVGERTLSENGAGKRKAGRRGVK